MTNSGSWALAPRAPLLDLGYAALRKDNQTFSTIAKMPRQTPAAKKKTKAALKANKPVYDDGKTPETNPTNAQSRGDQQRLLNIFSDAFGSILSSGRFPILLQEIKQALFNRNFGTAFGKEEYLEAYAARWSPTRALCYASLFRRVQPHIDAMLAHTPDNEVNLPSLQELQQSSDVEITKAAPNPCRVFKMLCIGGCAAEQVAFASHVRDFNYCGELTLLDAAPWTAVTSKLQSQLTSAPPLSKYASATAKAANAALIDPSLLAHSFSQVDVLALDRQESAELFVSTQPLVLTMLFTLNELYAEGGIGKTTRFLHMLSELLPSGSLLLVVDSPGSYSETVVGKENKRYPMQWLLDHTLMDVQDAAHSWERLSSEESTWFRLPEGLHYPIQLENMRYQLHLYRIQKK